MAEEKGEALGLFVLETLTTEILAACRRRARNLVERRPPRWLQRVRERLHEEFASDFELGSLAVEAGVTREHAARVFRDHYGFAMGEYVRRRRVRFACERLRRSDQPLADVALEAGFSDQSHMTRLFRRLLGRTPAALRRTQL